MKDILEFDGLYKVNEFGEIYKLTTNGLKKMKNQIDKDGYEVLNFKFGGKVIGRKVHRLVAQQFIPTVENKDVVDHIDEDKTNNNVENLRWCTAQENASFYDTKDGRRFKIEQLKNYSKQLKMYEQTLAARTKELTDAQRVIDKQGKELLKLEASLAAKEKELTEQIALH